jgi:hypothetical protein
MSTGDLIEVNGYVTKDKFLVGRTLKEIEGYLGFHTGRLSAGATFVKLTRLPSVGEFQLAAYSMTAAHRHATPPELDISKLKSLAMESWKLVGGDRLIKVMPTVRHNPGMSDNEQYPPGAGVPQWRIMPAVRIPGIIVAEPKTAADSYKPLL